MKPIITETTMNLAKKNWFTFSVPPDLNKNMIRRNVEKVFGVNVVEIKTIVVKGKSKRSLKSRIVKKKPDWKKAMVRLKEGQKIDIFETGA